MGRLSTTECTYLPTFEINSKSCIFEWDIFEIGSMPLCRIFFGLVSHPKIIWGE